MPTPALAERLRGGDTLWSGWSALPEPLVAEAVARAGFDCITFDVQHGLHDVASLIRGIGAVALAGKPSLVRIPVGDNALASRAVDMGAEAVIAPMISNATEARALVAAIKYPPIGERSWGPARALTLRGAEPQGHLDTANTTTLAFAMIETSQAMGALDDILSVPGLDGVFVGPSDLSITISDGRRIAPFEAFLDDPLRMIVDRATSARKFAGIFAANPERAKFFHSLGYRLIAVGTDHGFLMNGAKAALAALK